MTSTSTPAHRLRRHNHALSWRRSWQAVRRTATAPSGEAQSLSRRGKFGQFVLHYVEMCAPMCIGFAVGDALYFWLAGAVGYSKPFSQLPELSVLIVTVSMTAPMTAWMLYRRMPHRPVVEMSAVMPVLALALLLLGWTGAIPKSDLALTQHGLMMPAMLIPMLLRLDFYAGRATHPLHERETTGLK